ncbi:hypothetical protein [Pseudomonas nitroreducens]|uniref:hypothetical protein n=1 Tax=Pseudomonas nitroreducens TaxID=46680 RepID=UPI002659B65E|nr:hypothetical protein [Pseudomonas nitroreducens]MCP1651671.1 hypothetical protein [Pseudomonas nitroreducens]MCP1684464.1 hypothetical protein [Pseudomonas nitroreducens]
MSKFNPGDLAMTKYPIPKIEAGSVVTLERSLEQGDRFTLYGVTFIALARGWICSKPGIDSPLAYAETSLMPLKGDFQPEQQKAKEVEA